MWVSKTGLDVFFPVLNEIEQEKLEKQTLYSLFLFIFTVITYQRLIFSLSRYSSAICLSLLYEHYR